MRSSRCIATTSLEATAALSCDAGQGRKMASPCGPAAIGGAVVASVACAPAGSTVSVAATARASLCGGMFAQRRGTREGLAVPSRTGERAHDRYAVRFAFEADPAEPLVTSAE